MHIYSVNHRIRIAEALDKSLAGWNFADLVFIHRVVHHHEIGVDRATTGLVTHTQCVKRVKRIGPQLNTSANFPDLGCLL